MGEAAGVSAERRRLPAASLLPACASGYALAGNFGAVLLLFLSDEPLVDFTQVPFGPLMLWLLCGAGFGMIPGVVSFTCLMLGRFLRARELHVWLWGWMLAPLIGVVVIEVGFAAPDFLPPGMLPIVSYGMLWFGSLGTPLAMLAAHFRAFRVISIALAAVIAVPGLWFLMT